MSDYRLRPETFKFVLITVFAMAALNLPASIYGWGWKAAAFNTGLVALVYVGWIWKKRDKLLLAWLILGAVAGFMELGADWWLVHETKSLIYPENEPHLAASPIYMPGAWMLVLVQVGVIGQWLWHEMGLWKAMVATGAFAALNIPLYEHLAKGADWWYYVDTPMIFSAPWYIVLGEALLGPVLVLVATRLEKGGPGWAPPWGFLVGLWIFVAYWIAWTLVGPCEGALIQLSCG